MDLALVTRILILAGLISMMLSMGLRVSLNDVLKSMCRPRTVVLSLVANYVLVPAVTVGLLAIFQPSPMSSAGLLILAVCPGAPVGPPFVSIAKGDTDYATGLMVLLAGTSALLSPLALWFLFQWLFPEQELTINYLAIVRTLLVSQLIPLGSGLYLRRWSPRLSRVLATPLAILASVLLLAVIVLVLFKESEMLATIRVRGWMGMLLLLFLSMGIGWLSGGPGGNSRKTLALTTAARNAAVALVIVSGNLINTPAVTVVTAFSLVSILGTFLVALLVGGVSPQFQNSEAT